MSIARVGGPGAAVPAGPGNTQEHFDVLLRTVERVGQPPARSALQQGPQAPGQTAVPAAQHAEAVSVREVQASVPVHRRQRAQAPRAVELVGRVADAQLRMDRILRLAESGRTFTPAELLAFQAHVQRASQELDLAGKVVEKATGGVKQVLQTQV
jgi:hypothetical protein